MRFVKLNLRTMLVILAFIHTLFLTTLLHIILGYDLPRETVELYCAGVLFTVTLITSLIVAKPFTSISEMLAGTRKEPIGQLGVMTSDTEAIIHAFCRYHDGVVVEKTKSEEFFKQEQQNLDYLRATVEETTTAMDQIYTCAQNLAQDVESGTKSALDVAENTADMKKHIDDTNVQIQETSTKITKGRDTIGELLESQAACSELAKTISDTMTVAMREFTKVSKTILEIQHVADEVKVLSLNTAIEATRSGESGKGFAVIAQNIQKLADDVKSLSATIADIVPNLTESMSTCSTHISKIHDAVGVESLKVKSLSADFADIVSAASLIKDSCNSLVTLAENLDNSSHNLATTMESLSAISEENAASAEEVSSSVSDQSVYLNKMNSNLLLYEEYVHEPKQIAG